MARCLVALGSNLGDRGEHLALAIRELNQVPGIRVLQQSSMCTTTPVGGPPGQPDFLNAAVTLETQVSPLQLLATLQQVERAAGRQRLERWGARTLDLDLLLYDQQVVEEPDLHVPHPRMSFRRFVLAPAVEIAADWLHPLARWTVGQLWTHLQTSPRVAVIMGGDAAEVTSLVERVATVMGSEWTIASQLPNERQPRPRLVIVVDFASAASSTLLQEIPAGPVLRLAARDYLDLVGEIAASLRSTE